MSKPRHYCMICKKFRFEDKMQRALARGWVCKDPACSKHPDFKIAKKILKLEEQLQVLNRRHIFGLKYSKD